MSTTLATVPPSNSDPLLAVIDRAARDPETDVGKMERLLAMAQTIRATEAQSAFHAGMNDAQGEMRSISKDCHNPQTRSRYASYQAIDAAIRPIYTQHGFAMSFGSKASPIAEHVIVTCRVSHRGGHSEEHELDMPADGRGLKGGDMMTKTHATGSALTYGKRYLAGLIWNLSYGETDDDGNAASPRQSAEKPANAASPAAYHPALGDEVTSKGLTITAVEPFEGVSEKTGKPWKRWKITFDNGASVGTFDAKLATRAEFWKASGAKCDVTVKPGRSPNTFDLVNLAESDEIP